MDFEYVVKASVERTSGPFESRDTIEAGLLSELEGADPGSVTGDNQGEYEVTSWTVAPGEGSMSKSKRKGGPTIRADLVKEFVRDYGTITREAAKQGGYSPAATTPEAVVAHILTLNEGVDGAPLRRLVDTLERLWQSIDFDDLVGATQPLEVK